MASWSGKREFKIISRKLFTSEGLAFQRLSLSLLRILWTEITETPSGWSLDRQGVDHIIWGDETQTNLVVQCKGFGVAEDEVGTTQAQQCINSINKFIKKGKRTRKYILLYNREGRNADFRNIVLDGIEKLRTSGMAEIAEVWNHQILIQNAFDGMLKRAEKALDKKEFSLVHSIDDKIDIPSSPVEIVPVSISELKADQYQLSYSKKKVKKRDDPMRLLLSEENNSLTLFLGEYGFGKTTTIFRALQNSRRRILYVPGAVISNTTLSTKDFLFQCVNTDPIFSDLHDEDIEFARLSFRPVLEYLFKNDEIPFILVLDGLDESAPLSRKGAMQWLFNVLREVQIPIILVMRTEFWNSKYLDFSSSIGLKGRREIKRYVQANLLELLPWTFYEIRQAIVSEISLSTKSKEKENLNDLKALLEQDEFDNFYGDIPKRPLYLKFIIDIVKEKGVSYTKLGRATLFAQWARLKILRDINSPILMGGKGRVSIISDNDSTELTVEIAWEAMVTASFVMPHIFQSTLELLPECKLSDIISRSVLLREISEPTGLFLNSLLCLDKARKGFEESTVKFSHRSYQEYFLAWYICRNDFNFKELEMPSEVLKWIKRIENENIFNNF